MFTLLTYEFSIADKQLRDARKLNNSEQIEKDFGLLIECEQKRDKAYNDILSFLMKGVD